MHWIDKITPPIILGHRGASKYAPENTIAAFDLALKQKADGFELDTMLSADGNPVVIHDNTVNRTTNGTGKVDRYTAGQLKDLDAGSKFSPGFAGEKIPLLEEVFTYFKGKALINVELKNFHTPSNLLPKIVFNLAQDVGILDQIIFSSFFSSNLKELKRLHPEAHVALLCVRGWEGFLRRSFISTSISPDYIHPYYKDCKKWYLNRQNNIHRKVNAWTVDKRVDMVKLIGLGVTGIITNDPLTASKIKKEMNNSV